MEDEQEFIVLTADQAAQFRGETGKGARLEPVPIKDGRFILPKRCLADKAHTKTLKKLRRMPTELVHKDQHYRGDDGEEIQIPKKKPGIIDRLKGKSS